MLRPIAVLIALGSSAWASSWSSFEPSFPAHPCHDGWAGCIVDGVKITPDMVVEGGTPRPADLRVDFMSLEPTASFSPFVGLSEYTGEAPAVAEADAEEPAAADVDAGDGDDGDDGIAAAPPPQPSQESIQAERAADEAAAAEAAARASEEEARRQAEEAERAAREAEQAAAQAAREEEQRRKEAERLAAAAAQAEAAEQAKLKAEAEAARKAAEEAEKARLAAQQAERERQQAEEEARRQAEAEEKARQEAAAAAAAAEAEARRQAELERQRQEEERKQREAEEAARKKAEEERLAAEAAAAAAAAEADAAASAEADEGDDGQAAVAAAAPVDDGSCDDLTALEPPAMLGKLSDGQIGCLENSLAATSRMTEKKKISLLLMGNAFSKGDRKTWEQLVKRHLDEIDQSDPDLCYKYALHLARKGPGRASGVIRWANVALENRTVWTGDTYKARVNSLYKMRAAASQMLWQSAEQEHASAPSESTQSKIEKYRNMTKVNAREWYEYAKASGKDPTKALQLCMSAAGTSDYCEAG